MVYKKDCRIDNRMLKIKAVQKPFTPNPSINLSANRMINAFITKRNNPKVKMVTGSVKIIKIGLTNRLRIAKTKATIMAPRYPSTLTPPKRCAKIKTARALIKSLIKRFIQLSFFSPLNIRN